MSLQNAACGFGAWLKRHNLIFYVPMLGAITIGSDSARTAQNLKTVCRGNVVRSLVNKGRTIVFTDNCGEVLRFSVIGCYVQSFSFKGAALQIPREYIYCYGGKNYLSDICIEGHMIWIKNNDEIKLKPVENVPCTNLTLEFLGIKPKAASGANLQKMTNADARFKNEVKV